MVGGSGALPTPSGYSGVPVDGLRPSRSGNGFVVHLLLCYPILILSDYYTRSEAPRKIDYLLVTAEVNYMWYE